MEKLIIEHNKPRVKRQSIKDECYRLFDEDLTIREIIDTYGFLESSVKYYRSKWVSELIYRNTRRGDEFILGVKTALSDDEMDYGTDLPTYTYQELTSVEKVIYNKI